MDPADFQMKAALKLKTYVKARSFLSLLFVAFILAAIPITTVVVQNTRDLRSRAETGGMICTRVEKDTRGGQVISGAQNSVPPNTDIILVANIEGDDGNHENAIKWYNTAGTIKSSSFDLAYFRTPDSGKATISLDIYGVTQQTCIVQFSVVSDPTNLPVVDLKANGILAGPGGSLSVNYGSTVQMTWSVTNAAACNANSSPYNDSFRSGLPDSNALLAGGTNPHGVTLTQTTTLSITCNNSTGQAGFDSLVVNVSAPPPTAPPPTQPPTSPPTPPPTQPPAPPLLFGLSASNCINSNPSTVRFTWNSAGSNYGYEIWWEDSQVFAIYTNFLQFEGFAPNPSLDWFVRAFDRNTLASGPTAQGVVNVTSSCGSSTPTLTRTPTPTQTPIVPAVTGLTATTCVNSNPALVKFSWTDLGSSYGYEIWWEDSQVFDVYVNSFSYGGFGPNPSLEWNVRAFDKVTDTPGPASKGTVNIKSSCGISTPTPTPTPLPEIAVCTIYGDGHVIDITQGENTTITVPKDFLSGKGGPWAPAVRFINPPSGNERRRAVGENGDSVLVGSGSTGHDVSMGTVPARINFPYDGDLVFTFHAAANAAISDYEISNLLLMNEETGELSKDANCTGTLTINVKAKPTPLPTQTPRPTSTPTPTPAVTGVTIQGHHVDEKGQDLTTSHPVYSRTKVGIQPQIDVPGGNIPFTYSVARPYYIFTNINEGSYTVQADVPSGFSVSYLYGTFAPGVSCSVDQSSAPTKGNTLAFTLPSDGWCADVYFKYTPTSSGGTSTPTPTPTVSQVEKPTGLAVTDSKCNDARTSASITFNWYHPTANSFKIGWRVRGQTTISNWFTPTNPPPSPVFDPGSFTPNGFWEITYPGFSSGVELVEWGLIAIEGGKDSPAASSGGSVSANDCKSGGTPTPTPTPTSRGCSPTAPEAPTLRGPSAGELVQRGSISLDWDDVIGWGEECGAEESRRYILFEKEGDGNFGPNDEVSLSLNSSASIKADKVNTTYYWQIGAVNKAGWVTRSEIRSFKTVGNTYASCNYYSYPISELEVYQGEENGISFKVEGKGGPWSPGVRTKENSITYVSDKNNSIILGGGLTAHVAPESKQTEFSLKSGEVKQIDFVFKADSGAKPGEYTLENLIVVNRKDSTQTANCSGEIKITIRAPSVSIQGKFVDEKNQEIRLPNQSVIIKSTGDYNDYRTDNPWVFRNLKPGTHTLKAASITGYKVSSIGCPNCLLGSLVNQYQDTDTITLTLENEDDYADVYFRYTPSSGSVSTPTPTNSSGKILIKPDKPTGLTSAVNGDNVPYQFKYSYNGSFEARLFIKWGDGAYSHADISPNELVTVEHVWQRVGYFSIVAFISPTRPLPNYFDLAGSEPLEVRVADRGITEFCQSIISNGPTSKKLDVTFVPQNYPPGSFEQQFNQDINNALEAFRFYKPYSTNINKMNFSKVVIQNEELNALSRQPNGMTQSLSAPQVYNLASNCPTDKIIILFNARGLNTTEAAGFAGLKGRVSIVAVTGNVFIHDSTTIHEFSHELGGVLDEYQVSVGDASEIIKPLGLNCSNSPEDTPWKGFPGAETWKGCSAPNWYRSSKYSLMGGPAYYYKETGQTVYENDLVNDPNGFRPWNIKLISDELNNYE